MWIYRREGLIFSAGWIYSPLPSKSNGNLFENQNLKVDGDQECQSLAIYVAFYALFPTITGTRRAEVCWFSHDVTPCTSVDHDEILTKKVAADGDFLVV
jgi:hypothetical protein